MAEEVTAEVVLREGQQLVDARTLLQADIEELDTDSQVLVWSMLDLIEKNFVGDRKKKLGKILKQYALDNGEADDKGSKTVTIAGGKVKAEARKGSVTYDLAGLQAVLKEKGIDPSTCIRTVYEVDPDGVKALLKTGMLTKEDVVRFSEVGEKTFSLRVTKPRAVTDLLPR